MRVLWRTGPEAATPLLRGVLATNARARGLRAIEAARKALAAQTLAGKDPRASANAGQKRGKSNAEQHRRNREWKLESGDAARRDRAWFLREITPKLDAFSLAEIARATGLSLAACSRIRSGYTMAC